MLLLFSFILVIVCSTVYISKSPYIHLFLTCHGSSTLHPSSLFWSLWIVPILFLLRHTDLSIFYSFQASNKSFHILYWILLSIAVSCLIVTLGTWVMSIVSIVWLIPLSAIDEVDMHWFCTSYIYFPFLCQVVNYIDLFWWSSPIDWRAWLSANVPVMFLLRSGISLIY